MPAKKKRVAGVDFLVNKLAKARSRAEIAAAK
jgi:hypothetical protein